MNSPTLVIVFLLSILVLLGCSVTPADDFEESTVVIQVSATVVLATQEPLTSPTPFPTEKISTATRPASTATSTIQPAFTPRPTRSMATPTIFPTRSVAHSSLSEEEATQNLIELLGTNRGCELPCWWGITPGETNVNSIETTFVQLGFDWYRDYEELKDNAPHYLAMIYLTSANNVVQSIKVRGGATAETYDRNEAWRPYAIQRILDRLGKPENVYVYYPFRFDPGGMQAYHLFMYYPDLGVEIDYLGVAELVDERPGWARACANILQTDDINLFLYQPAEITDYLELTMPETSIGFIPHDENTNLYDMVSWEQATESSLDEFVQLFSDSEDGDPCFEFKTYWTGD